MRYALPGAFSLISICIIVVSIQNSQTVSINLFGSVTETSLALGFLTALATGVITGLSFSALATGNRKQSDEKLETWDAQDAKLKAEVKSDREKQLEAKIDTLETALKSALNKNK